MNINFKELGTPSEFWEYFNQVSKIPRCSGREQLIREYIKKEAEKFNFPSEADVAGNLLVSALPKKDDRPTVIIQSHMDMVCEKNENITHDFLKDPLKLKIIEIDKDRILEQKVKDNILKVDGVCKEINEQEETEVYKCWTEEDPYGLQDMWDLARSDGGGRNIQGNPIEEIAFLETCIATISPDWTVKLHNVVDYITNEYATRKAF